MNVKVTRGSITFEHDKALNLEEIKSLIGAAGLLGVPPTATVSHLDYRLGGSYVTITLNWESPRADQS